MKPETRAEYRARLLLRMKRAGFRRDHHDLTRALFETYYVVSDADLKKAWREGAQLKMKHKPCP